MTDPLAPTAPEGPEARARRAEADAAVTEDGAPVTGETAAPRAMGSAPMADPLERAMSKAKAAAALFGDAVAVQVGRYRLIERAGAGGMGVVWSAWDPELNRGVALKLATSGDAAARARARDEGRALAKLSHPNVVPIYDVFEAPEGVFLVMELVKGRTLREVATDGATVGELVRAYRQCGEGLAAAHAAGLVHRDFKPDNAILGADGRVRVLDFGLAHEVAEGESPVIAGTPRYMAPEQRRGDDLTAAVDQYALCVALREAVTTTATVPAWLEPILARGAAADAAARFPSMDALVAALALDPAARWRRRGLAASGVVAAGAVVAAFTLGRARQAEPPCQGSADAVASAWGGAARTRARTHLATLAGAYATESVPRVVDALDRYAGAWVDLHQASCKVHARRELSDAAYDRRTACLARRKAALGAVAEVADGVSLDALPGLVTATTGLPELAACADDDALLSPVAPPAAAQAPEAAAIADLIAKVDVERDAGRSEEATRDADAALARARTLAYAPLVARALVARGRIDLELGRGERGSGEFTEATALALEVGDEALAIEAYARNVYAIATTGRPDAAMAGIALIEALARRAGAAASFARALLHNNVGTAELAMGDRRAASTSFRQARREAAPLTAAAAVEMVGVLENLMQVSDDPDDRIQLGDELVDTWTRLLGADHPKTLEAAIIRGGLQDDLDEGRAALADPCRRLAALHPAQRQLIRECAFEVSWRAAVAGQLDLSAQMARVVRSAALAGDQDSRITRAEVYLAYATGHADEAAVLLRGVAPVARDAPWWRRLVDVDNLIIGALVHATARPGVARRDLDQAEVLVDALGAPPMVVSHRRQAISRIRAKLP
ncbi:MAG: serine/threonine-protein kinase [Kofleriaceae bacterium]